jgi:sugar lactone lactonase YvrE
MAFDPKTGSFFVGSMHRRKIVRRDRDGRVRDWAGPERGLWSILGIKIDASRGELWANSCNMGDELPMTPADPATVGRGALLRLRLTDGSVVRRYEPAAAARPICFNDLALSPAGEVYLTAGPDGLWRLPRGGDTLEPLIRDTTLWLNGIATGPGGEVYVADDSVGPLLVEPTSGKWRRVATSAGSTLRGIDGLYVHAGALLWIQNGVEPARVVRARLAGDGMTLRDLQVLDVGHPDYAAPTTGVVVGDTLFYVATAQLAAIRPGGRVAPADSMRENVILRLPIPRS